MFIQVHLQELCLYKSRSSIKENRISPTNATTFPLTQASHTHTLKQLTNYLTYLKMICNNSICLCSGVASPHKGILLTELNYVAQLIFNKYKQLVRRYKYIIIML